MSLLIFVALVIVGLQLICAALVVWLTEVVAVAPALLGVGIPLLLVAVLIYVVLLRQRLRRWQRRIGALGGIGDMCVTIYRQMTALIKEIVGGY